MKILLLSPLPPPVGGIATWTKNVLQYYSDNSRAYELVHCDSAIPTSNNTNKNRIQRILVGIYGLVTQFYKILQSIRKENPSLVHMTSSASLGLLRDYIILQAFRSKKRKFIVHFRFGRIPELAEMDNWEWKMISMVVNKCDRCIVIDQKSYQTLISKGFSNVDLIANPIADTLLKKTDVIVSKSEGRETNALLFVGHVTRDKGVYELVTAFSKLNIEFSLKLIGPVQEDVKNDLISIAGSKVGHLHFLGVRDHDFILNEMCKTTIFILPSYTEGFPNVIIEAMICQCAIIATSVGAIPEMLDGESGICIRSKNVEDIVETIYLLANDTDNRVAMGMRARTNAVENFSMKSIIEKIENIWKSLRYV